jgi:hypothetical protein
MAVLLWRFYDVPKAAFSLGYSIAFFMPSFILYPKWFIPEFLQLKLII